MPLEDRWDAEAVLGVRATPRKPTPSKPSPSTAEDVIRAPLIGEDPEVKDPRELRKEILERRGAANRDGESGAGQPRPETSNEFDYADVRRFRITEAMLLKYGSPDYCQGCDKRAL